MSVHHDNIVTVCQSLCAKLKKQIQDVFKDAVCFSDRNLESKQFFLERQKQNIFDTFTLLEIQLTNWELIKDELESKHKMLQLKLHESILDASAKKRCIEKFKETFSAQYVQIEHLKQYNKKLETNLECFKNELNRSHLSEEWYKNRLYSYQSSKSKLNFDFEINKEILEQHIKTIQAFNRESKQIRKFCPDKDVAIAECENNLYEEIRVRETIDKETQTVDHRSTKDRSTNTNTLLKSNDLNEESDFLKQNSHELRNHPYRQELNLSLEKSSSNVKRSLIENQSIIETFKHFEKQLCEKLIASKETEKNKNIEISLLMKDIDILKAKMFQKVRENENLEGLTFKIYNQFMKLKSIQGYLKALLNDKERFISVLYMEKMKLVEDNNTYRNIEFHDKNKIRELSEAVDYLELENRKMPMLQDEELFDYNKKFDVMDSRIQELQDNSDVVVDTERNCFTSNSRNLRPEFENTRKEFDSAQEKMNVWEGEEENQCILLRHDAKGKSLFCSGPEFEILRSIPDPKPNMFIELRNKDFEPVHENITAGNIEVNISHYGISMRNRLKQIEDKLKRITKVCSRNIELLFATNSVNVHHLITKMNEYKILTEVKEREKLEQQEKFEKYVRVLLGQVREYKKSYVALKEQNVYLKDLFETLIPEPNITKSLHGSISIRSKSSSHYSAIGSTSWDTDNIHCDSGFTSFSDIPQSNETSVDDSNLTTPSINQSLCGDIQRFDTRKKHKNLLMDDSIQILTIAKASSNHIVSKRDFDNIMMLGSYLIDQLKSILSRKEQHIATLFSQLFNSEKLLKDSTNEVNFLQKEITMINSQLQRNIMTIDELKQEKLSLENGLKQREALLGKIFVAFKQKLQTAVDEANDKFFLQRLCSDLKFAIKMYAGQNKILRDVLHNRNKDKTFAIDEKSGKYCEKFLTILRNQQEDYCIVKESFVDIQSCIDAMKKQMLLLQTVVTQS